MCLRITFRERPGRAARFCNRYLSSTILAPDAGPLGNRSRSARRSTSLDAIGLIEAFEGRPPHVTKVGADIDMRRGEQLAFLRRSGPRAGARRPEVKLRVTMQRVRGGT